MLLRQQEAFSSSFLGSFSSSSFPCIPQAVGPPQASSHTRHRAASAQGVAVHLWPALSGRWSSADCFAGPRAPGTRSRGSFFIQAFRASTPQLLLWLCWLRGLSPEAHPGGARPRLLSPPGCLLLLMPRPLGASWLRPSQRTISVPQCPPSLDFSKCALVLHVHSRTDAPPTPRLPPLLLFIPVWSVQNDV